MKEALIKQIREHGIEGAENFLNTLCLKWFLYGCGLMGFIWVLIVLK